MCPPILKQLGREEEAGGRSKREKRESEAGIKRNSCISTDALVKALM